MELEKIIKEGTKEERLALFRFSPDEPTHNIMLKFNLWARYFFPNYFSSPDAPFHQLIDERLVNLYKGDINSFVNIAFRGSGKTTRAKLFMAYVIINDKTHLRKFIKILSKDMSNGKQIVTDIYNMFVNPRVKDYYPNIFRKSDAKREETMSSFTTSFGVKLTSDTVGTDQRGQIQETARPDFLYFDDFETRKTLRSAVETQSIWDNMEEARTGLSKTGVAMYSCNYVSERGNVHRLVTKQSPGHEVLITPIIHGGTIAWSIYSKEDIARIESEADDYSGEYLCLKPTTPILTAKGWKNIKDIKVGDEVITHRNRTQKVLKTMSREANDLLDITVNGITVSITKNHPVLAHREKKKEWIPAGELTTDDLVYLIPHDIL